MNKKISRIRRAKSTRNKLYKLGRMRLVVHRTPRHIYAQIISSDNSQVMVSASTVEKIISCQLNNVTSNKQAAAFIGKIIALRAIEKNIVKVSFDRSGFKYHGRIQELANCARQWGLEF